MKVSSNCLLSVSLCNAFLKLILVVGVVGTNMLALYSLSVSQDTIRSFGTSNQELRLPSSNKQELMKTLLHEMQEELRAAREELAGMRSELQSSLPHIRSVEGGRQQQRRLSSKNGSRPLDLLSGHIKSAIPADSGDRDWMSPELRRYVAVHELPMGRSSALGSKTLVSPIGHSCYNSRQLLETYMSYEVGKLCPDDWAIAQRLMLEGCEPLPRRRCFAQAPCNASKPKAFPESLWAQPPDESVRWTLYKCKSFDCLNQRKAMKVSVDCVDCFDLNGLERKRWVTANNRHDLLIEDVLRMKEGSIRVGLDLGGGGGSFAARMREHNVTIITTTLNLGGPFNEFVALRGLPALYLTVSQRLPFFDNTLDLVHSMHVLSDWLPKPTLEFLLYDIDRVLRPGGLFWIDRFFCTQDLLSVFYIPMLENLGYKKIKWTTGMKTDRSGIVNNQIYLTALLEKPNRM